jgi:hypothetical protein
MNNAKIAAALHALADAFAEEAIDAAGTTVKPAKGKSKAAAEQPTTAAAPVEKDPTPETAPAAPVVTITKEQLNKVVLAVAAKSREKAEAILAKFGAKNTVTLPTEQWQGVFDAFEEELAKIDAAAVQVQQASLV